MNNDVTIIFADVLGEAEHGTLLDLWAKEHESHSHRTPALIDVASPFTTPIAKVGARSAWFLITE
ncbi:MAG: hypothetical protein AB7P24_21665 [Nitrospira sp.]